MHTFAGRPKSGAAKDKPEKAEKKEKKAAPRVQEARECELCEETSTDFHPKKLRYCNSRCHALVEACAKDAKKNKEDEFFKELQKDKAALLMRCVVSYFCLRSCVVLQLQVPEH